jgi:hypothetical protein
MRGTRLPGRSLGVAFRGMPRARPAPYVAILERRFWLRRPQPRSGGGLGHIRGAFAILGTGRGILLLAIVMSSGITLGACGGNVNPYETALDDLKLPSTWQAALTVKRGDGGNSGCVAIGDVMCPSVTRFFNAPGGLSSIFREARTALEQSGFTNVKETQPDCDMVTNGPRCFLAAARAGVAVDFTFFPAKQEFGGVDIAVSDEATIRVIARKP